MLFSFKRNFNSFKTPQFIDYQLIIGLTITNQGRTITKRGISITDKGRTITKRGISITDKGNIPKKGHIYN